MKLRTGFVSNSSSTSFYFMLNGGKKELLDLIMKYRMFFDFPGPKDINDVFDRGMDAEDLVEAIDKLKFERFVAVNDDDCRGIDDTLYISDLGWAEKEAEKQFHDYMVEAAKEENARVSDSWSDAAHDALDMAGEFRHAQKRGLKNLIRIDMGDNHGDIEGGLVGNAMDCRGNRIRIDKADLMLFTKPNR